MTDPTPPTIPTGLRILALGDSYTVGKGVEPGERWPERLAERLREDGRKVAPPQIVAVTGWSTEDLAQALDADPPQGRFDLVTLLIGVNDQYDEVPVGDIRQRVGALMDRAVGVSGGEPSRVVAISVPDWGVTPFGAADARGPAWIAEQIDGLNAAAQAEALARGIAWVDVTEASRHQGDRVVADGLHPDARAYASWTDRILPTVRAALATRPRGADGPAATPRP